MFLVGLLGAVTGCFGECDLQNGTVTKAKSLINTLDPPNRLGSILILKKALNGSLTIESENLSSKFRLGSNT